MGDQYQVCRCYVADAASGSRVSFQPGIDNDYLAAVGCDFNFLPVNISVFFVFYFFLPIC